jgi:hypothetical protein
MKSFEQMVKLLMTYEGKPLSPRKININTIGRLPQ